jgi:hypothetical protein
MFTPTCLHTGGMVLNNDWNDKSRMNREVHVRFRERLGLKCLCLLDFTTSAFRFGIFNPVISSYRAILSLGFS